MRIISLVHVASCFLVAILAITAQAQEIGQAFFPRSQDVTWNVINDEGRTSRHVPQRLPWVVNKIEGARLWFEENGRLGWVQDTDVVSLDDAAKFFSARLNPREDWPLYMYGQALMFQQRPAEAIPVFGRFIARNPSVIQAYKARAICWSDQEEWQMALEDYNTVLRLGSMEPQVYSNRGVAWGKLGEHAKAVKDFDEALRIKDDYSLAYVNRALAHSNLGAFDKATADHAKALRIAPEDPFALRNHAWLLATCPDARFRDGEQATQLATKACEVTDWKDANCLGTLAAAYAETSRFEEAIRFLDQAYEIEPNHEIRAEMKKAFAEGEAYRDFVDTDN